MEAGRPRTAVPPPGLEEGPRWTAATPAGGANPQKAHDSKTTEVVCEVKILVLRKVLKLVIQM
jgi:hypothetical protein